MNPCITIFSSPRLSGRWLQANAELRTTLTCIVYHTGFPSTVDSSSQFFDRQVGWGRLHILRYFMHRSLPSNWVYSFIYSFLLVYLYSRYRCVINLWLRKLNCADRLSSIVFVSKAAVFTISRSSTSGTLPTRPPLWRQRRQQKKWRS